MVGYEIVVVTKPSDVILHNEGGDACLASTIDKNLIFEEQCLIKRVFDDGVVRIEFFARYRVRTNLLQSKGLFNHTTVYIYASMIMLSTVMVEIFAYMVGAEEVSNTNRLSDDVVSFAVSIQQPPLSSLAYYSLTRQQKDFPGKRKGRLSYLLIFKSEGYGYGIFDAAEEEAHILKNSGPSIPLM
uniref:Uncharacterized protein n=1 Tax=Tanacetum cinerariifolium TaxID=118510 RepID=A0A6L2KND5_TANCI|nr:hypothetical protein [Tanacetum cinerariifolium]